MPEDSPVIKKKFEVKLQKGDNGSVKKAVFIDGELLDWSIDVGDLMETMRKGPEFFAVVKKDVEKHYLDSVSEFLGRGVTAQELMVATKTGWI